MLNDYHQTVYKAKEALLYSAPTGGAIKTIVHTRDTSCRNTVQINVLL